MTQVIVTDIFVAAIGADGLMRHYDRGGPYDLDADDVSRLVESGAVRLADDADASVPTGDERSADEGEAVGTDADEPLPPVEAAVEHAIDDNAEVAGVAPFEGDTAQLDKDGIIAELEARSLEFDKRWGVERLRGVLDAALAR